VQAHAGAIPEADGPSRRERNARAALEDRCCRVLSDAEWESAKRELLAFIRLLAEWNGSGGSGTPSRDSGGVLDPSGLLL
jgi:hypothetical protein